MPRFLFCLTLSLAALVTISAYAQETADEKAVREVIERELKGALAGDPEQVKSCYSSDFIGFGGWNSGDVCMYKLHSDGEIIYIDPEDWRVSISTPAELDKYAEAFRGNAERVQQSGLKRGNEVVSVHVKNGCAVGVTRHWGSWLDKSTNENVMFEARSVWMLKKEQGTWKIFSNIGQMALGMMTIKALP